MIQAHAGYGGHKASTRGSLLSGARGLAVISVSVFDGSGDTQAALRGTGRLLYDLIDRPDQVRAASLVQ